LPFFGLSSNDNIILAHFNDNKRCSFASDRGTVLNLQHAPSRDFIRYYATAETAETGVQRFHQETKDQTVGTERLAG
jgi:hypothetical protein